MSVSQWLIGPFLDYGFMRRALAGASALSLGPRRWASSWCCGA